MLNRRRFAFWVSFGLFSLADRLRLYGIDELAAAMLNADGAQPKIMPDARQAPPGHWRVAENDAWRWIERESFVNGQWTLSGITTPVNKATGARLEGKPGYLDEALVPPEIRFGLDASVTEEEAAAVAAVAEKYAERRATEQRRTRHGRPPSKWLRSLRADELRIWLKTIHVPEAGVSGMTYWEHLTRDHAFDPANIEGLTEPEQAKLHAAAHFGY